ncbi:MAG: bifunctional 3-deoxy-7-phosphoheptulonate synthase/chorismate mutase type II [Flavobacteriales bacterium]|nr:bifunctional 3-deoxy-7-phosphoheptulonate synthase/chorismate mutase type II [Flavobacteriales bacterium]MCB9195762.1 bifunctional 3-deoxy-7-phosphoheptulonate synthase/chorismate mutase type II [Flavobacteriales bacterium]MCB9198816.1 bifunctional 3-deoxy-7-phosphoheptulonate synthase/chorismate mutase type II [Flavobacteriales bacterium]
MMTIAKGLRAANLTLLRGGIWKPRTRPNSFEGVGELGLPWLKSAGELIGVPVTTEVAKGDHVEMALNAGVDVLWIGARTTVNPFAVQEIADALKGVDIPVMVKNPVNPDVDLWMGAIERLSAVGIKDIAAIHRGFSSYGQKVYRNVPMWELPIELKVRMPEIKIICDPSHICGRRDLLKAVAQKSYDLDMDGLMIETHHLPDEAWSDASQQITPSVFKEMISELIIRKPEAQDLNLSKSLEVLRSQIDQIDHDLIQLLATRMKTAREIGEFKKENDITILQLGRWKEIHDARKALGENLGLSEKFLEVFLNALHKESINQQNEVMNISRSLDK